VSLYQFGYNELINAGYRLITPSKIGYGNTSHAIGGKLGAEFVGISG
jgi:hypothetical protein